MASLNRIVLGILILQIYVHAAPSDVSKLEDIAKVEQTDPKLDSEPKMVENDSNSTETQRQKRWYNPYGLGFPPINPLIYPNFNNNEGPNTGFYGGEDPLAQIYRRLQEIANIVRQPPPPPPHIPLFYPVLFVPSGDCRCNDNTTPGSDTTTPDDNNNTTPSVLNRWPEMEDERQNWGVLVNETDEDDEEDFSRPISFDPIRLNRPMRPAPPVEHGTIQSQSTQGQTQSEAPSSPPQNTSPPKDTTQNRPASFSPSENKPQNSSPPQNRPGLAPPSACDGAILTCCHQPQVYYDCFAIQGCPDFTSYGNPCDPNLILRVIERFQAFYGQKTG